MRFKTPLIRECLFLILAAAFVGLAGLGLEAETSALGLGVPAAMASGLSTNSSTFTNAGATPIFIAPLWRFGIARVRRPMADYDPSDIASMRFGWYVDWGAGSSPLTSLGIDYVPMIRVRQVKLNGSMQIKTPCRSCPYANPYTYTVSLTASQIQANASSHPGRLWVIGNEIDRVDWGDCSSCGQDEILPELYAQAYHDIFTTIKSSDPTAQVAIGGMVQATSLRLKYLDRVWAAYSDQFGESMPVDVWNIHVYVLQELRNSWGAEIPAGLTESSGMLYSVYDNKDFSLAVSQIVNMRTWMREHGQAAEPLIITEYGVNMPASWCDDSGCPFAPEQVRDSFMVPSFNYFLTAEDCNLSSIDSCRLVQRWNWYSFDDDSLDSSGQQNFNANLFDSGLPGANPQGISTLGLYWKQYVQTLPPAATKPY